MVGTVHPRELSAPARGSLRVAVATTADDAAIRALLRTSPMRGAITLTFEREPDYFRGADLAGGVDRPIVAYDGERLICAGRCTTRPAFVNGRVRRVAYLGELRLAPDAAGRIDALRGGWRFFRTLHERGPADFTFTSIAADNVRARRLLERGLPWLPRYEFLGELTTLVIDTASSSTTTSVSVEPVEIGEAAEFLRTENARRQFATPWSASLLASLASAKFSAADLRVVRREGKIAGCLGLWDQRSFRQAVIRSYARPLIWARPLLNIFAPLLRQPRLPSPGAALSHAFLSPLAIKADAPELLPDLIAHAGRMLRARGIDFLTLALPAADARLALLRPRFRCRPYVTRLYRVIWPGGMAEPLDGRPLLPEVSLL